MLTRHVLGYDVKRLLLVASRQQMVHTNMHVYGMSQTPVHWSLELRLLNEQLQSQPLASLER